MIEKRASSERGHFDHGWLKTYHTFSFADYYDPQHVHFKSLRVINEDFVAPGQGFGTHPHRDMEIITYILDGELQHKDSMGTGSIIRPGDVQQMSAGTGVLHSEFNPSKEKPVHLMQIWIMPNRKGITPKYEQKAFSKEDRSDKLRLVASSDGREGSVLINQDASIYASLLGQDKVIDHAIEPTRGAYLQVARGSIRVNDVFLAAGDGAAVTAESKLVLTGVSGEPSEFLFFDLA